MMRVYIAFGSALVFERLQRLLGEYAEVLLVGSSSSADNASKEIIALRPDVLVCDIRLGTGNAIRLIREARASVPTIRVVVLTDTDGTAYRTQLEMEGVQATVDRGMRTESICSAVLDPMYC